MSHHRKPSPLTRVWVVAWSCCLAAAAVFSGCVLFVAGWMLSGDPFLTAQVEGTAALIVLAAVAVTHVTGRLRRSP